MVSTHQFVPSSLLADSPSSLSMWKAPTALTWTATRCTATLPALQEPRQFLPGLHDLAVSTSDPARALPTPPCNVACPLSPLCSLTFFSTTGSSAPDSVWSADPTYPCIRPLTNRLGCGAVPSAVCGLCGQLGPSHSGPCPSRGHRGTY